MNHWKRYGAFAALGLAALVAGGSGCGGGQPTLRQPGVEAPGSGGSRAGDVPGAPAAGDTAADTGAKKISQANRAFGLTLLQNLSKSGKGNVLISPHSIAQALSLVYNGAEGDTQKQMASVLGYEKVKLDELNQGSAALRTALTDVDPKVTLYVANALWSRTGLAFADDFTKRAEQSYGAKTGTLDFGKDSAVDTINEWVKQNTKDKIDTILSRGDIGADTPAVIVNAVYFKGLWKDPFDKNRTQDAPFTLADGKKVTVPMMSRTGSYGILRKEGLQAVSLPYGEGRLRFLVFVPSSDLGKFVAGITPEKWEAWMGEFAEGQTALSLPRFKMAYSASLNDPLKNLGMKAAFAPGAKFGQMGVGDFRIAKVQHKAVMEVNEEGTEAAAATGVVGVTSMPGEIRVDRPFLCAITDTRTGALLFAGVVHDPTAEK